MARPIFLDGLPGTQSTAVENFGPGSLAKPGAPAPEVLPSHATVASKCP